MSEVSVDLKAIGEAKKSCLSAEREMKNTINLLTRSASEVTSGWKDQKVKEFEGIVNQCVASLKKPADELKRCDAFLSKLSEALQEYESIHFSGSGGNTNTSSDIPSVSNGDGGPTIINSHLAGQNHPESGVPYVHRSFSINGQQISGGFPVFDGKFDATLPDNMLAASDDAQFKECTAQLAAAIESNPSLAQNFTPRQLTQIRDGAPRISGLTWHHREYPPGSMQLVNSEAHATSRHTGGRSLWGGGRDCR